jgi:peptidoglycan-associated lipoprotein
MKMSNKFGLLVAVIFTVMLASCGSNDTIDESADSASVNAAAQDSGANSAKAAGAGSSSAMQDSDLNDADLDSLVAQGKLLTVYYFDFDNDTLTADTRAALDKMAKFLSKSNISVKLNGHADERGTREYNLALSERRAKSVRDYLAIQGVDSSRIEVIGFGEEKPAVAQSNAAAWAKNRRVQLVK